jgi:hypothetical protein
MPTGQSFTHFPHPVHEIPTLISISILPFFEFAYDTTNIDAATASHVFFLSYGEMRNGVTPYGIRERYQR